MFLFSFCQSWLTLAETKCMNPGTLAHKILGFVFPDICLACGRRLVDGEKVICLHCQGSLPRINCIPHTDNAVHRHLASTIPIEEAAAMFVYRRGDIFTKPIHTAKYGGRPAVARELGRMFAARLDKQSFFNSIDAITPVPLHWWKHIKRGYNQSEHIARGIADITGIPVHTHLLRASGHGSQTQLSRTRRWENASATYLCKGKPQNGIEHILVVDDVITTGATILACCHALHQAHPQLRISVLSLAMTENT